MQKIIEIADLSIFFNITLIIVSISNPYAILYSLIAKIPRVTCLLFIENQYMIFALLVALAKQII